MYDKYQNVYKSGFGKLLHIINWSRPYCLNIVRERSQFTEEVNYEHMVAMLITMKYCVKQSKRGLNLRPSTRLNDDINFEFLVRGKSDFDYVKCPETEKL